MHDIYTGQCVYFTLCKVIALANHKGYRQLNEPIKTKVKYICTCSWHKAHKNVCVINLVLHVLPVGWKCGASFLRKSCSVVMQNELLLDTQVKTDQWTLNHLEWTTTHHWEQFLEILQTHTWFCWKKIFF